MRKLLRTHRPLAVVLAVASAATLTFGVAACGDDDDEGDTATTSTEPSGTEDTGDDPGTDDADSSGTEGSEEATGGAPSQEFCDALADFEAAEDGAQRTTAIGDMVAALEDAATELTEALDTLLEGDLDPSDYEAAEAALQEFGEGC